MKRILIILFLLLTTSAQAKVYENTSNKVLKTDADGVVGWRDDADSGGSPAWGTITGTLSSQTDLNSALAGKASSLGADDNYVTDAEKVVIGNTSGTNTGDNATNSQYSGLVTNATHTGDATGSGALTVEKIRGKTFPTLGVSDDEKYPKYDNDTSAFIMTSIAGGGNVTGDDTSTTAQNIVAYSGTGGLNITELTGTQGDILYHNGTSWAKLGTGTAGQILISGGAGANPSWGNKYVLVATLASDQATGANTTPVTLTGLSFTYEADSKYRIWFMGRVSPAAATTGCGFQFDLSSAVTSINVGFYHQLANTGTLSGGHSIADDASVGVSSGMPSTSTYPVIGEGILITTSNTGTAQLRFRSETTAVTTAKAGMTLVVEKIQ